VSHVEKLKWRFLHDKKIELSVSVTHLILETAIVQNKCWVFKQKSINTKELCSQNFEVSLHFWLLWPTVCYLGNIVIHFQVTHFMWKKLCLLMELNFVSMSDTQIYHDNFVWHWIFQYPWPPKKCDFRNQANLVFFSGNFESTGCKSQIWKIFEFRIWKEPMLVLKQTVPQFSRRYINNWILKRYNHLYGYDYKFKHQKFEMWA
jgi:hypothetical protein